MTALSTIIITIAPLALGVLLVIAFVIEPPRAVLPRARVVSRRKR